MCQPKDKGGRRCPTHQPASIGLKKFMNEQYGLLPDQIEHTFKMLRAQAANAPAPTPEQYAHLVARTKTKLENSTLSDKAKRSINRQLNKQLTEQELPDGATFHALKKLQARSREQKAEFVQMIREIANHRGTNRNEALKAFREQYAETEGEYEADYSDSFDAKSRAVAAAMLGREGITSDGMPEFSSEPRITRQPVEHSNWVASMGYDPDDGRLEVETTAGGVYAYHSVPQDVWERAQANRGVLSREVFRNPEYAYESREQAEADSVGRYCEDCHKYKAIRGHACDFSAAEAREAAIPEDILDAINNLPTEEEEQVEEKPKYSYEESLKRLRESIEAPEPEPEPEPTEEETPAPQRARRRGPSARQRRWAVPVTDREVIDLSDAETAFVDGTRSRWSRSYSGPRPAEIRREVIQRGNVATFSVTSPSRSANTYDENWSYTGTEYGQISQEVKAYIDNEDGVIKFERVGNLKCTCETYRRNYHCEHMAGTNYRLSGRYANNMDEQELKAAREQVADQEISKAIKDLHKQVDRTSFLRSVTTEGEPIEFRRSSRRSGRSAQYEGVSCQNNMTQTEWRNVRRLLDEGEAVKVTLNNMSVHSGDNYYYNRHGGTVTATLKKEDGEYVVKESTLACYRCGRNSEICPHAQAAGEFVRAAAVGETEEYSRWGGSATASRPSIDYENMDPATRLEQIDQAVKSSWVNKEEDVAEMSLFSSQTPTGVDHSYSANLDKYIEDVRAAEKKIKDGENPIPFVKENATNGACAPGSGRGFGVELEYDLPSGKNHDEVMWAIAKDMYEAGLSDIDYGTRYHGYSGNRWHVESDCTVAGEVVSPILQDTPEHWEELQKVCDIIKRHGGKASTKTGGHVHMGLGSGEPAEVERRKVAATQIYSAFEDTIRRVQADPVRKKHRDSQWCSPMGLNTAQSNIYSLRSGGSFYSDHHASLNLGHRGRIEFRGSDGSLDPAHIQAQVVVAAGIVTAAERGELEGDTPKSSTIGTNAKKMRLISKGKSAKASTDDELIVSDVEMRRFADDILGTDHGRKIIAGIAANTPWQESRYA